jgi:hypothetical protein
MLPVVVTDPRTEPVASPASGDCEASAALFFVPSRITAPPAQRGPSPHIVPSPPTACVVPWR